MKNAVGEIKSTIAALGGEEQKKGAGSCRGGGGKMYVVAST